jgi:hypothetical protein
MMGPDEPIHGIGGSIGDGGQAIRMGSIGCASEVSGLQAGHVDSEKVERFASLCALRDIKRDIKVNGMNREQALALVGWYQASPWKMGKACLAEGLGFRDERAMDRVMVAVRCNTIP